MVRSKTYFLSDFHLGAPDKASSLVREKKVVAFLDSIKADAERVVIAGDLFDFWYEYKHVVPKGYTRILGKLAELTDAGIEMLFFPGNHDMWMKTYFQEELNIAVYHHPAEFNWNGKSFLIGHGDGLGPGDGGYKFIKKLFRNKAAVWMFGMLPPSMGMGMADFFSRKSRAKTGKTDEVFLGEENEWLVIHAKEILKTKKVDFFIFGHRHLPLNIDLPGGSKYINLGDWIKYNSYAVFDGTALELKYHQ